MKIKHKAANKRDRSTLAKNLAFVLENLDEESCKKTKEGLTIEAHKKMKENIS